MDDSIISERIKAFNHDWIEDLKASEKAQNTEGEPAPQPVDLYQTYADKQYELGKHKAPRGSRPKVTMTAQAVLEQLAPAYKKAKDDSEVLSSKGDNQRVEILKQQYLQEDFLPAIEALVRYNSVDEVINNRDILAQFDRYASLEGPRSGFTATYIRETFPEAEGDFSGLSDGEVRSAIKRMEKLLADDQIRSAYGIAKQMKERVDRGTNIASEDDYEFLQRIVLRASRV